MWHVHHRRGDAARVCKIRRLLTQGPPCWVCASEPFSPRLHGRVFFLLLSCAVLDARRFGWLLLNVRFFPVLCALSFFWTAFEMMSTADRRRLISFAYVNSAFPHGDGVLLRCATHPAHVALRPWGNECHGKGGGVRACIPGRSCGAWRRKASDPLAVQPIFLLPA